MIQLKLMAPGADLFWRCSSLGKDPFCPSKMSPWVASICSFGTASNFICIQEISMGRQHWWWWWGIVNLQRCLVFLMYWYDNTPYLVYSNLFNAHLYFVESLACNSQVNSWTSLVVNINSHHTRQWQEDFGRMKQFMHYMLEYLSYLPELIFLRSHLPP